MPRPQQALTVDYRPTDQDLGHTGLVFREDHDLGVPCRTVATQPAKDFSVISFGEKKGRKLENGRKKKGKESNGGKEGRKERRRETRYKCEIGIADWGW